MEIELDIKLSPPDFAVRQHNNPTCIDLTGVDLTGVDLNCGLCHIRSRTVTPLRRPLDCSQRMLSLRSITGL